MSATGDAPHYIIKGGIEGRERLRVLARVMRATTVELLQRAGVKPGMRCIDVGCGGGDVTLEIAQLVAPSGSAVGTDIDETKLAICRAEAAGRATNVEFRHANASFEDLEPEFDAAYARFLLTHLTDPMAALQHMKSGLVDGGLIIVEDIDFSGAFCEPMDWSYQAYLDLYSEAVRRRGGDPDIGPRLPGMLMAAGFVEVEMNVVQPTGMNGGDVKLVSPLTMENIAEAVLAEGLADRARIDAVVSRLYEVARDHATVMSVPRIVQTWGRVGS